MIKEQIVTFGTAKLAKKKGFIEPDRDNHRAYSEDGELGSIFDSNKPHNITAPTQALLQKWLRDEHGIDINAIAYGIENREKSLATEGTRKIRGAIWPGKYIYDKKYIWIIGEFDIDDILNGDLKVKKDIIFDTHEEAFEEGLQKALKTIK
jgi:hypothetical protein